MRFNDTNSVVEIPMNARGRNRLLDRVALIDAEDYHLVSPYPWHAQLSGGYFYATTHDQDAPGRLMHRIVMGVFDPDILIDHINRDTLDNRKANLRIANRHQNGCNAGPRRGSSQYKGVSWFSRRGKWRATITVNRRQHSLGYFENEIDAALAYDAAARELHGDFAYLNFPIN